MRSMNENKERALYWNRKRKIKKKGIFENELSTKRNAKAAGCIAFTRLHFINCFSNTYATIC